MKRLFICSLLLCCYLCLIANPMELKFASEYWFNEENEMMVELCPSYYYSFADTPLSNLQFKYNDVISVVPNCTDTLTYYNPKIINLSELDPPIHHSHYNDPVYILPFTAPNTGYYGEDFGRDSYNLLDGMSLVQWYNSGDMGTWGWATETSPTPGLYPFHPQTHSILKIFCHDQFNNPVPNVNLSIHSSGIPYAVSDQNGVFQDTLYASRCYIYAYAPGIWQHLIYEVMVVLQPNTMSLIDIPVTVTSIEDNTNLPTANTGLKIYPVPFNLLQNSELCFQLPDNVKKSGKTKLKIYNTKGQFVTELKSSKDGLIRWTPRKEVASGIYTVRMISDNRIMETKHFSLIN